MMEEKRDSLTRRTFVRGVAALVPGAAVLAACGGRAEPARGQELSPTPECGDEDEVTPRQTEGPFYTPDSPARRSLLEPGIEGAKLVVTGRVLTVACRPVAGALVDFWHADARGDYDTAGYRLRGHQFTDEEGRYELETIVPGLYPGRTRHLHVKVQAPNERILTTQLYFPGELRNERDGLFAPALLMSVRNESEATAASFDFVLAVR